MARAELETLMTYSDGGIPWYYEDGKWRELRTPRPTGDSFVMLVSPRREALTQTIVGPHKIRYRGDDEAITVDFPTTGCKTIYARQYHRSLVTTSLDLTEILDLIQEEKLLERSEEDTFESGNRIERASCGPDDEPDAPSIEQRLLGAFGCDSAPTDYPTVCGVLQSRSLCMLANDRDAVRFAVAVDRLGHLLPSAELSSMQEVLRRMPGLRTLDDATAQRVARHLVLAIARDVVRNYNQKKRAPIHAIASFLKCKLEQDWGERSDLKDCDLTGIPSSEPEQLADRLLAALAPATGEHGAGTRRVVDAVQACVLTAGHTLGTKPEVLDEVRVIVDDAINGDDAGVFAAAITGETSPSTKRALHALALATTHGLTIDRVNQLPLDTVVTQRLQFGVALGGLLGGAYDTKAKTWWVPAPIAAPVGAMWHYKLLYTFVGLLDVGQYLSTDSNGNIRSVNGLDAFSASLSAGLRFGGDRVPLVVALSGGAARFATGDPAGFVGLNIGTFLPFATFVEK